MIKQAPWDAAKVSTLKTRYVPYIILYAHIVFLDTVIHFKIYFF